MSSDGPGNNHQFEDQSTDRATMRDAKRQFSHQAVEQYRHRRRESIKQRRREFWSLALEIESSYSERTHAELEAVVCTRLLSNEPLLRRAGPDHPRVAYIWDDEDLGGEFSGLENAVESLLGPIGESDAGFTPDADTGLLDIDTLLAVGKALDEALVLIADLPRQKPVLSGGDL